jgi:WD40 repeat protein
MSIAASPDGKLILTGEKQPILHLWDAHTGQELHKLSGHNGLITKAKFVPNHPWIITSG